MNIAFHTLAGLAIGQAAACRLIERDADAAREHDADAAREHDADGAREHDLGLIRERASPHGARRASTTLLVAWTFVLCVMSHGVLDGLPHEYPFRALGDTVCTSALFLSWTLLIQPRFRALLAIAFVGAVLPDLIDHVPRDLNRHLGLHLPVLPKLFPWHHREGSGSLSGDVPPLARVASLVNHVMVVTFSATVLWLSRRALRYFV